MHRISVGIIGFGRIGAEHATWLASARNARPAAVCDPTPARRALAESRGLPVHPELDPLLADPSIDAILVSTPTAMHFDHASRALAAGKHILVEKPIALTFSEAQRLLDLAREHKRILSVFHNRRWDIDYLTVRKHLQAGLFGRPINIESRLGQWASCVGPAAREYHPNWRNQAAFGGGGLYDWGSHFVDQIWRLLFPARPIRLFAQLRGNVWTRDCDDFARLVIDFDNGAAALVEINTTTTRPLPRWHVDGTAGSADTPFSLAFDLDVWSQLSFTPAGQEQPCLLPRASLGLSEIQIWERFASACLGQAEPAVTPESILPTMFLLDAARESSRTGRAVDLAHYTGWTY